MSREGIGGSMPAEAAVFGGTNVKFSVVGRLVPFTGSGEEDI